MKHLQNDNISILGYRFNNRIYGYLYDKSWTYYNNSIINKNNVNVSIPVGSNQFNTGSYILTFYNTTTNEIIKQQSVTASNGSISFRVDSIQTDLAFIIEAEVL